LDGSVCQEHRKRKARRDRERCDGAQQPVGPLLAPPLERERQSNGQRDQHRVVAAAEHLQQGEQAETDVMPRCTNTQGAPRMKQC
jgi:hypothetical protein